MKKQGWILIAITGAFFCLLIGVFLGRNTNKNYIHIESNHGEVSQSVTSQTAPEQVRININTATPEQLQLLPGIGETIAQRIIDYREKSGSFTSIEQLMNVSGIGEKKFEGVKEFITVNQMEE